MRVRATQRDDFPTQARAVQRLLVFARLPRRGQVKSRIARALGDERTLEIYEAMLADLLSSIGISDTALAIEVLWTAEGAVTGAELRRSFGDHDLATQAGRDLGERLVTAFSERILFDRAEKVIAIGTDDPTLTRADIEVAFQLLDSCEWVLGPASDGGYYLIGCRGESFFTRVFEDIDWGTSSVLDTTRERLRTRNQTAAILPVRRDLDEVEDLQAFARAGSATNATRLHQLLEREGIA